MSESKPLFSGYFHRWAETDVFIFRSYCAILGNFKASIIDNSEYSHDEPSGKNNPHGYLRVNDSKQKQGHKIPILAFILIKKQKETFCIVKGVPIVLLTHVQRPNSGTYSNKYRALKTVPFPFVTLFLFHDYGFPASNRNCQCYFRVPLCFWSRWVFIEWDKRMSVILSTNTNPSRPTNGAASAAW